ncbi:MAG: hypothetical protein R2909_15970 [Gemmatimonadales bacterium]
MGDPRLLGIVFDKLFVLGTSVAGSQVGTIEAIGPATTRSGAPAASSRCSRTPICRGSRLHNFGRMEERRAVFTPGRTYQTTREQLEEIPG